MHPAHIYYYYSQLGGEALPTIQATDLIFSNVLSTSLTLSWTNGDGAGRIVVARASGAVNSNPVNDTDYTANAAFGSGDQIGTGNFVVYSGTGSTVNITGLSAGTEYHFRVYEFNGSAPIIRYLTDTATGNPASVVAAFLFWAAFQDDDATPVANPYTTYSGHLMDVTQTASQLSIINGILEKTGAGAVAANFMKSQVGVSRARGRCLAFRFKYNSAGTTVLQSGFVQPAANSGHLVLVSANALNAQDTNSTVATGITLTVDTWYHVFIILRDNGAYWIINIDSGYYLFYVSSRYTYATLHQYIGVGGTASVDWARAKQLADDFTSSDWGLATASITSAVNGNTFTHGASGWIVFFVQTKTTSGTIELRFRIQDSSNYLKIVINSSNVGKLFSVVGGSETQLGSDATMTQSAEYRVFLNGTSVRVFNDGSTALIISGTDSNFQNNSSGELTSQGTGGDVTYIHCLPFGLTDNGQISELEAITSISEPP